VRNFMSSVVRQVEGSEWAARAAQFHDHSYRQCRAYAQAAAARLGASSEYVAVDANGEEIGLANVRIKRVPVLPAGIAYISGGPLVRRDRAEDAQRLKDCLGVLRREYVQRRGLVLRVSPLIGSADWSAAQADAFAESGFVATERAAGYRTIVVDLRLPAADLRKRLAQKWRNCLNKAERAGVVLRTGTDAGLFGVFCGLFDELVGRKAFRTELDAAFYAGIQGELAENERLRIAIAEVEGRPIAGHVSSMLGDTGVYLLGASGEAAKGSNASYLLQWDAMLAAKERGMHWYDLGGIDPEANPGVYHFKQGMGGEERVAPGPFEAAPRGVAGAAALGAERLYRAVLAGARR
jgi:lipid II:glycine glycyltransferase (peptidoglycan interpeptide bridge formation enzyme)